MPYTRMQSALVKDMAYVQATQVISLMLPVDFRVRAPQYTRAERNLADTAGQRCATDYERASQQQRF